MLLLGYNVLGFNRSKLSEPTCSKKRYSKQPSQTLGQLSLFSRKRPNEAILDRFILLDHSMTHHI